MSMTDAQKLPNSIKIKLARRLYTECPDSLAIYTTLIESNPTNPRKLIRLNKRYHRAVFDRIFDHRSFSPTVYVIFKFAEIYLNGDITVSEMIEISDHFDGVFLDLIVNLPTHKIIKDKYKRYNSDDRLRENYRELAAQTLQMYLDDSNNRSH
jgi:hypothetical protein